MLDIARIKFEKWHFDHLPSAFLNKTVRSVLFVAGIIGLPTVVLLGMYFDVLFLETDTVISKAGEDLAIQYYHWRNFAFSELASGNFPLWNPHVFSGAPFLAGSQTGLLYPIAWAHLLLPLKQALNLEILIHLVLASSFMTVWARSFGLERWGSQFAGLVYMLSGPVFAHVVPGHLSNLATMAWAPLIFYSVDNVLKTGEWKAARVGILAVTMQLLAGHLQYVYYCGLLVGLYAGCRLLAESARLRKSAVLISIYGLPVLLCAVQLFTTYDASTESIRSGGTSREFASTFFLPVGNLLTSIMPGLFGGVFDSAYFGKFNFWEMSCFLGVGGTSLALLGAVHSWRTNTKLLVVVPIIALTLAFGVQTPLFDLLYDNLPGFNFFRGVSKFVFLAALFGALLSGVGASVIVRANPAVNSKLISGLLIFGVALGLVSACLQAFPSLINAEALQMLKNPYAVTPSAESNFPPDFTFTSFLTGSLSICAGVLVIFGMLLARSIATRGRSKLILIFAMAELVIGALAIRHTYSVEKNIAEIDLVSSAARVVPQDSRFYNKQDVNGGMSTGTSGIWGSDPMVTKRYGEFIAFTQGLPIAHAHQDMDIYRYWSPWLAILRYVPIFDKMATNQPVPYYSEKNFQRVSIFDDYVLAPDQASVFAEMRRQKTPSTLILEQHPDHRPDPGADRSKQNARIVGESTDAILIEAELEKPGILVVSDNYSKDWKVSSVIDGPQDEYSVIPANYVLRAVSLAAGKHRFIMHYTPTAFVVGLWVSIISLVLVAGFILLSYMPSVKVRFGV